MTWVGLARTVPVADVELVLKSFFDTNSVGLFDDFPLNNWPKITGTYSINCSQFPLLIDIHTREYDWWEVLCLARCLSNHFSCNAICDDSGLVKPKCPFWSLVWKDDQLFLADNCDTMFADEYGGEVKILRRITFQEFSRTEVLASFEDLDPT